MKTSIFSIVLICTLPLSAHAGKELPSPFPINKTNETYWHGLDQKKQKEVISFNDKMKDAILVRTEKQEKCLNYNDAQRVLNFEQIYIGITTRNAIVALGEVNRSKACNTVEKKVDCLYKKAAQLHIQKLAEDPLFAEILQHHFNDLKSDDLQKRVNFFQNISNEK